MLDYEVFLQQLITGLSNGMIIALIALGYTMVYGIIELINFAHGDLFMLGSFLALTVLGVCGLTTVSAGSPLGYLIVVALFVIVPLFCALLNWLIDRLAYKPLRQAPRLAPLVSAIGVSFVLMNIGLFWGGLPLEVFNFGNSAAAPKDFPALIPATNLLGDSAIQFGVRDAMVFVIAIPLMLALTYFVRYTRMGKAMRAVAQNPMAAELMGINIDKVIGITFMVGGALGGAASVVYALCYNTIYFQMGFRVGIDAFTAAVLGGIGNLPGALLGGVCIGIIRAMSDQYLATQWTNTVVFGVLIAMLVFRPSGLLGMRVREKV
ncbi:MAG: branched-chain amino acid ABC transporter permease [Proteobacteria bacterium]|nr:branched-chain amino acid ABC transporter permease [Pseudomonadota bacterium]